MAVTRINLRRNLPRSVAKGFASRVELILSSEFFDAIPGLITSSNIFCSFLRIEARTGAGDPPLGEEQEGQLAAVWVRDEVAAFDVAIPDDITEGVYRVRLRCELENGCEGNQSSQRYIVLPWISGEFTIVSGVESSGAERMLSSYREFEIVPSTNAPKFLIQEEYGAGIGSHIYDSAVVLLRYFSRVDLMKAGGIDISQRNCIAIELGSGCGLVGLFLGGLFKSVFLTDKCSQMALLQQNVSHNQDHHPHCHYQTMSVEWASAVDRGRLLTACREEPSSHESRVDLIVAADVLYDLDAAISLVDLLLELMTTVNNHHDDAAAPPIAIVAQKMRGEEAVDVATLMPKQLIPRLVHEEYSVKVWLICLHVP